MITVDKAIEFIEQARLDFGSETVPLHLAHRRICASDIFAKFTQPAFPMSLMDGYALRRRDITHALAVIGESRAGAPFDGVIGENEAVRIFTGAIVPEGADYVEIQERAVLDVQTLTFSSISKARNYIRPAGSDFKKNSQLFTHGTLITPAVLATLAMANYAHVTVQRPPSIELLRSGDELRPVGSPLKKGQLIDSNGPGLMALIQSWGFPVIDLGIVPDDPTVIRDKISNCQADIIISVGGASVGDYDYMKAAFSDVGFESVFQKVAVKPGKPVWLSRRKTQVAIGLPGKPNSAWVSAHLFLSPLLGRAAKWNRYNLTHEMDSNGARESYIRGKLNSSGQVTPVPSQTDRGRSMAEADVLIRRPSLSDELPVGHSVDCLHI